MQLHQIRYVLAVAEHGGIGAAATAMGLARPTVSQAVRELERELGTELFHRIGRGMVLTAAGHAFVGPANRIVRDVVAAEGALPDTEGGLRGSLDVHTPPTLAVEPVAGLVAAFRRANPRVTVRIGDLRDEERAAGLVRDGQCEIVVCHLPVTDHGTLRVVALGAHEYWVVYPPGSDLPDDDPLPLSALPDIPLVAVPRDGRQVGRFEAAIAAAGKRRRPAAIVQHREARLAFVQAGMGGTFLERAAAETARRRGMVVRATDPAFRLEYGLLYDESALSPAGRAMVTLATGSERS